MPSEFDLSKWPRWALITAAVLGMTVTGAIGTAIGVKVADHEVRIIRIEENRFTAQDGAELVREMKSDLRDIKAIISTVERDVAVLKSRGGTP